MADKPVANSFAALATVLGKNLTEIEDLPNYVAPPPGVYKLMINSCGEKTVNEKTAIVVDYTVLELKSLNNGQEDQEEASKIVYGKDKLSEAFYFNQADRIETVLGVLKKKFGGLGSLFGTTNLLEILQKLPNTTVEAQLTRRQDEHDKSKFYASTKTIVAAA